MDPRFRYKSGYRKNREQLQVGRIKPIWPNKADMCIHPYYWIREFAIKQGDVKLKNESQSSWEKYILDFLFYIRVTKIVVRGGMSWIMEYFRIDIAEYLLSQINIGQR